MRTNIRLHFGDITKLYVDAIVNASNERLSGGGGVDGAIHMAAGKSLSEDCKKLKGCNIGEAKITKGYKLPSKHVIHTVGPVWGPEEDEKDQLLASCYRESLELASEHKIKSIAFPNISTGIYGYPLERAAKIAIDEVNSYIKKNDDIETIIFVTFSHSNYSIYKRLLQL